MIIWRDGEFMSEDQAGPSLADRGFLLGDGLFETLRISDGVVQRPQAHANRLARSRKHLGLEAGVHPLDIPAIGMELAARNGLTSAAMRITLTRGAGARGLAVTGEEEPSTWMSVSMLAPPPETIRLATSSVKRDPTSFAARHKTLSYIDNIAARAEAQRNGADMALMLTGDGRLSCADCANLFWMRRGKLYTPDLGCAVLPGTVRKALTKALPVVEGDYRPDVLEEAELVFVTNALLGAVAVSELDGGEIASAPDMIGALRAALG